MRVGEAEGDPEGDGRRTLANGWESRLWRLEDKHLREGSSVRQFGRPRPLRIRQRRRRSLLVCSWMWECVCERSAKSSAKSRSSSLVNRFQRIPLFLSCVVCLIAQSMVMLKSNADITHPCLTLKSTGKLCWLLPTLQLKLL